MCNNLRELARKSKKLMGNERGQGLVEYALILTLIAVVAIVMVRGIGQESCKAFSSICSALN